MREAVEIYKTAERKSYKYFCNNATLQMAEDDYDHFFKFPIVGPGAAGKSSLFSCFTEDFLPDSMNATIGANFRSRVVDMNGERVQLQIWDTAGAERFRPLLPMYLRGSHGVMIVYDVTDRGTFQDVKWFLNQISQHCDNACKILVGNKNDKSSRKEVGTQEAVEFGQSVGVRVFETSVRENIGVEEMFYEFIHMLLEAKFQSQKQRVKDQ